MPAPGARVDGSYVFMTFLAFFIAMLVLDGASQLGDWHLTTMAVFYALASLLGFSWVMLVYSTGRSVVEEVRPVDALQAAAQCFVGIVLATAAVALISGQLGPAVGVIMPRYEAWPGRSLLASQARQLGIDPNLLLAVYLQLMVPTAEESMFRIVFLNSPIPALMDGRAVREGRLPLRAILVQAVLFGLYHTWAYRWSLWQIWSAMLVGALLGWLYWRTGRESAPVWGHMLYNIAVLILRW